MSEPIAVLGATGSIGSRIAEFLPDEADSYLEMVAALNSGKVRPSEPRLPAKTTPMTLEDFARSVFAPVYRAAEDQG
jgi:aspartate-semialdehyde dehydrogenase